MGTADSPSPKIMITAIMLAVLAWGIVHAIGAYLFNLGTWDFIKGLVILACVVGFLAFWLILLKSRRTKAP